MADVPSVRTWPQIWGDLYRFLAHTLASSFDRFTTSRRALKAPAHGKGRTGAFAQPGTGRGGILTKVTQLLTGESFAFPNVIHGVKGWDGDADFAEGQRSDYERWAPIPPRTKTPVLSRGSLAIVLASKKVTGALTDLAGLPGAKSHQGSSMAGRPTVSASPVCSMRRPHGHQHQMLGLAS